MKINFSMKKTIIIFFLVVQSLNAYDSVDCNNLMSDKKDLVVVDLAVNEARVIIINNLYLKWLEIEADESGLNRYLSLWDSIGGEVEIEHRLKNSREGRPIALRILFLAYLEREPTDLELAHYIDNWLKFGYYDGIETKISKLNK